MADGVQIVCTHCDQVNRIPEGRPINQAKCGRCGQSLFDGHPAHLNDAGLSKQIERSDIPVVVDFWAQWCGPCRAMAPAFEQSAAAFGPSARFVKVDVDKFKQVAGELGVQGIPALFVFRGGDVVGRQTGALSATAMYEWIKRTAAIG